jgi:altronate hydrolase
MVESELVVATICGGSDGTSAITANPAVGRAFDHLVAAGATCIFEETGELIGCETIMASRAITLELGAQSRPPWPGRSLLHHPWLWQLCQRQCRGGLTTIEEKSMGAYAKSGASPSAASSSRAMCRRPAGSTCSMSFPTARCASASQHQRQCRDR